MLSVAQAVHHPETPGSASKHSTLGHSWSAERSSMLKRRKTESECSIVDKKAATSCTVNLTKQYTSNDQEMMLTKSEYYNVDNKAAATCIESITRQFKFNDQEITLTAIPKSNNQNESKDLRQQKNASTLAKKEVLSIINKAQEEKIRSDEMQNTIPPVVKNVLENFEEIQLIKLSSNENKKIVDQNDDITSSMLHDTEERIRTRSKSSRISETTSQQKNIFGDSNPISELSEVTIEPCSKSQKPKLVTSPGSKSSCGEKTKNVRSRLAKAQEYLHKKKESSVTIVASSTQSEEKSTFELDCKSELDEVIAEQHFKFNFPKSISPLFDEEPDHQIQVSAVSDYEPFNVGISCDTYYINSRDKPYYAAGFPNPLGENRCWINSTLQALFTLPIINELDTLDILKYSKLMTSLASVYELWSVGNTYSNTFDQCFTTFKEELSVLDKLYSSKAQQDVSEFIMNLLNFIKTKFEAKLTKDSHNNEIENIPNNEQDTVRKAQNAAADSNKRLPLADISTSAVQLRTNQVPSVKTNSSLTTPKNVNEIEDSSNPIDEYFSLYMVENYVCNNCSKERQQKVENLMLFVDLPSEDHGDSIDLVKMINTTYEEEQRNMTCESCKHDMHSMVTLLKRPPKILTVQVKRYEMTNDGLITKKFTSVDIPHLLKLDSLIINNSEDFNHFPEYEPICIISHIGDSIDSGHYISFVKHHDKWFYYDDMNVKLLSADEVMKCVQNNAYMIFFQDTELSQNIDLLIDQKNKKENAACLD